jgi:hypothetical protein
MGRCRTRYPEVRRDYLAQRVDRTGLSSAVGRAAVGCDHFFRWLIIDATAQRVRAPGVCCASHISTKRCAVVGGPGLNEVGVSASSLQPPMGTAIARTPYKI